MAADILRMLFALDQFPFALLALAVTIWVQVWISRAYSGRARLPAAAGFMAAQIAVMVMRAGGVTGVGVEPATGELSDHYDCGHKVLRLSEGVCAGRSLAAFGVAAHEAGHAIQDASGYRGLALRNLIVPLAAPASHACWLFILAGLLFGVTRFFVLGIVLFSLAVLLQLVNLPIELDASRRGRAALLSADLIRGDEEEVTSAVTRAAAFTYLAATLTSFPALLFSLQRVFR